MEEDMEDFMVELIDTIKKDSEVKGRKRPSRLREFIAHIVTNIPEVEILGKCDKGGDVRFSVAMKDLGLTFDLFLKYKKEIFSDYMANFLGELLIRENVSEFSKLLMTIKADDYHQVVNGFEHRQFGMEVVRNRFIFSFHVSLLQTILTEDFKEKVR